MRDIIVDLLILPMPILWLLILGVVLWRWKRLSRAVFLGAAVLFVVVSLPVSGKLLIGSLRNGAPPFDGVVAEGIDAILVPTGGTFGDGAERWWPTRSSARRVATALRLRERLGLPIILSGGSPEADRPPEVETLAEYFDLTGDHIRLEPTARNSSETAAAVAAMLANQQKPRVILVTSATHIARMSATLRHHGVIALAAPLGDAGLDSLGFSDFLPSHRGLNLNHVALREYIGIGWYLVTDRIDFADLSPS